MKGSWSKWASRASRELTRNIWPVPPVYHRQPDPHHYIDTSVAIIIINKIRAFQEPQNKEVLKQLGFSPNCGEQYTVGDQLTGGRGEGLSSQEDGDASRVMHCGWCTFVFHRFSSLVPGTPFKPIRSQSKGPSVSRFGIFLVFLSWSWSCLIMVRDQSNQKGQYNITSQKSQVLRKCIRD